MNKSFYQAIYENTTDAIIKLMQAQCKFIFLSDSFNLLKNNKKFYKTLDYNDKKILDEMIQATNTIITYLDNILSPIAKVFRK